jgi:hypothetical protein
MKTIAKLMALCLLAGSMGISVAAAQEGGKKTDDTKKTDGDKGKKVSKKGAKKAATAEKGKGKGEGKGKGKGKGKSKGGDKDKDKAADKK